MPEPTPGRRSDRIVAGVIVVALLVVMGTVLLARLLSPPPEQVFHAASIYGDPLHDQLFSPFGLGIARTERLLQVDFGGDPDAVYVGLELQVLDDDLHGTGMLVVGRRADGRIDLYHQPSVTLGASHGAATAAHVTQVPLDDARLELTPSGVDAFAAFSDVLGRDVQLSVVERGPPPRATFRLLAPTGAAAAEPRALPLK